MSVSTKHLSVLAILAFLSVVFSLIFLLGKIGIPPFFATGFATIATGVVNVTITATTDITLVIANVDFGTSTLLTGGQNTTVNTSDTVWGGNGNPGTFANPGPFMLRNNGNTEVNLTVNSSNTAATFIGGTNPGYYFVPTYAGARDGCGFGVIGDNITSNTSLNPFSTTAVAICDNLTFADVGDQINISIFIDIPTDATSGLHTDSGFEVDAVALCGC